MRIPRSRRAVVAVAAVGTVAALVAVPTAALSGPADNTRAARNAIVGGTARNVILLIGDGMGDSEITIARNYAEGAAGRLALDTLPLTGAYTTYSVDKATGKPDYVPDSAATGTAWATGFKTYDNAVSVTRNGKARATVLERAQEAGYRVGNVTTSEIQDATPAVLAAHVTQRACYGPDELYDPENEEFEDCRPNRTDRGGLGSISEQHVAQKADVLLGGGSASFDQTIRAGKYKGDTVLESAQRQNYRIVDTAAELRGLGKGVKGPILGLFAEGNLETEYAPLTPSEEGTDPTRCSANPERGTQPHLSNMANKAIQILDARSQGKKKGFFLQIEGASIDKRDHAADLCGQIGENVEFDDAVRTALDFQKRNPDTLVVVTADHGHSSQIVEAGATTTGVTASVTTADDAEMTVSYATAPYNGGDSSQSHTGTEVRIAAKGPQAANVLGVTDQTELNTTLRRALGL